MCENMQNYKCLKMNLIFLFLSPITLFGMESSSLDDIVRKASPQNKQNAQELANIVKECLRDSKLFTPKKVEKIRKGISGIETTPGKTREVFAGRVAEDTRNNLEYTPTKDRRNEKITSINSALNENTSNLNCYADISTQSKIVRISILNVLKEFLERPESLAAVSTEHIASPKIKRSPDGRVKGCLGGHNLDVYLDQDFQGQVFESLYRSWTFLLGGAVLKSARFGLSQVEAFSIYQNSIPISIQEGGFQFVKDTRDGASYQVLRDGNNFFSIKSLFPIPVVELKDGLCEVGTVGHVLPDKSFQEIQKIVLNEEEFRGVVKNGISIPVSTNAPYKITNITRSFHDGLPQGKILKKSGGVDVPIPMYAKTKAQPKALLSEIKSNKFKKEIQNAFKDMQDKRQTSDILKGLYYDSDDEN